VRPGERERDGLSIFLLQVSGDFPNPPRLKYGSQEPL
jgi:hypothetical protein